MHGEGVFKEVLSKHKFWPPCAVTNTRKFGLQPTDQPAAVCKHDVLHVHGCMHGL